MKKKMKVITGEMIVPPYGTYDYRIVVSDNATNEEIIGKMNMIYADIVRSNGGIPEKPIDTIVGNTPEMEKLYMSIGGK